MVEAVGDELKGKGVGQEAGKPVGSVVLKYVYY